MGESAGRTPIAALAYGTETIARVDKIVGPGNAFVNEAKLLVSRDVAIDLPAGPSEVVVVRRPRRRPRGSPSSSSPRRPSTGPTRSARSSTATISRRRSREVERLAPEHVVLLGEAEALADRIRNAGAIFVGESSPVASGDYATGGNHVLPTNGWARSVGGLGLETFLKPVTVQRLTAAGLALVRPTVEALAAVERMRAHAEAVRAMRTLPAEFPRLRVGAVDRGACAPRRARPGRDRPLRRQRPAAAAAERRAPERSPARSPT